MIDEDMQQLLKQKLDKPIHPGVWIAARLKAMGMGPTAAANAMGLASRPSLSALFAGNKPMTERMAFELGRIAEVDPYILLRLQLEWDYRKYLYRASGGLTDTQPAKRQKQL